MNTKINKMIKISLLLSVAIVVNFLESLIVLPLPFPGVKLGLANCIGLMVLYLFKEKDYVIFNFLKLTLIALLRTGFGYSFFIGMCGTTLATIFTLFAYKLSKASIYGLSVIGAVFHSLGQIIIVIIIYNNIYMINYLLILVIFSTISGLVTAFIASVTLQRLPKYIIDNDIKK